MALNPEYHPNPDIPRPNLLVGRVALVTGASKGIGRAIAEALAYHGAGAVVINSTERSKQQAEEALEVIESYGAKGLWVPGRLEEKGAARKVVEAAIDEFGSLHILVNNAGITKDTAFLDSTNADFDEVMRVNFDSARLTTRAAIEYLLLEKDRASIIFMSSVAVHGNPGQTNYAASKGAIEGLMRSIAVEHTSWGLRANAIAPALVDTQMAANLSEERRQALINQTPLGRLVTVSEIAEIAVFLASDMSRVINGQVINADGGMFR